MNKIPLRQIISDIGVKNNCDRCYCDNQLVAKTLPDGTVIRGSFKAELRKHEEEWVIHIHTLTAIDHGGGKVALQAIIKVADEYCIGIRLEPLPYRTTLTPNVMTKEWLTQYYERYGFKTNGKWMLRHPVDNRQQ